MVLWWVCVVLCGFVGFLVGLSCFVWFCVGFWASFVWFSGGFELFWVILWWASFRFELFWVVL